MDGDGLSKHPSLERHFIGHKSSINRVRFNPNFSQRPFIATSAEDASVILWDLKQSSRCIRFSAHQGAVNCVCWSPNGRLLTTAGKDGIIRLWEAKIRSVSKEFVAHGKAINSVEFDHTGTMVASASDDKSVKLWKVGQRKFLTSFLGHTNWVRAAKFNKDSKLIASCGDDKTVRIFDINSGECIRVFRDEHGMGRQVAWHPDGNLVAVGLTSNRVKIFDIAENELIQLYQVHAPNSAVNDISFHPSGNFLLTGSDDCTLKILDLLEGRPIYTLTGHNDKVRGVDISKDGERLASVGMDRQLLIWKSNLNNFDSEVFKRDHSVDNVPTKPEEPTSSASSNLCNESILIDPSSTAAYKTQDENFLLVDSEHTTQLHSPVKSNISDISLGATEASNCRD